MLTFYDVSEHTRTYTDLELRFESIHRTKALSGLETKFNIHSLVLYKQWKINNIKSQCTNAQANKHHKQNFYRALHGVGAVLLK